MWVPSDVRWPICVLAPIDAKLPITELGPITSFGPILMKEFNWADGSTDADGWMFWNIRFWNAHIFAIFFTILIWVSHQSYRILTCPKSGPFKFGIGNIGRIGIWIFGMGKGCGKGNIGLKGLNANEIGDDNNNVAETYKKTLSVNMLTRFRCTTRNRKVMTDID